MDILKQEQKTYIILALSNQLKETSAGNEEKKVDYQIASRIYANAFASLLRDGCEPNYVESKGMAILTLELEDRVYECPARTIKNILKAEFVAFEEKLPDIVPLLAAEEQRIAEEQKNRKKQSKKPKNMEMSAVPVSDKNLSDASPDEKKTSEAVPDMKSKEEDGKQSSDKEPEAEHPDPVKPTKLADSGLVGDFREPVQKKKTAPDSNPKSDDSGDSVGEKNGEGQKPLSAKNNNDVSVSGINTDPVLPSIPKDASSIKLTNSADNDFSTSGEPQKQDTDSDDEKKTDESIQESVEENETASGNVSSGNADILGTATQEAEPIDFEGKDPDGKETAKNTEDIPANTKDTDVETEKTGKRELKEEESISLEAGEDSANLHPVHAFRPKEARIQTEPAITSVDEEPKESEKTPEVAQKTKEAEKTLPKKEGLFAKFFPKNKSQEIKKVIPEETPAAPDKTGTEEVEDSEPDVIPEIAEEIPGTMIRHTHVITLKKTYGTQVAGPYVIHIWPTEVIEMNPDKVPCGIFVRAESPNGKIELKVNEGRTKFISLIVDDKQFNIFGSWQHGQFISEVSAINKTASVYTMNEHVEKVCPETAVDAMLDQFRSREPRKPEFFVVPIESINHGEDAIPIAAYVRVNEKNYVINKKGKGNFLYFTYANELSEISGRWKDGKFEFTIKPVETQQE